MEFHRTVRRGGVVTGLLDVVFALKAYNLANVCHHPSCTFYLVSLSVYAPPSILGTQYLTCSMSSLYICRYLIMMKLNGKNDGPCIRFLFKSY